METYLCVVVMLAIFKCYFLSGKREVYRAIANEYDTSPVHVYRLAHGRRGKCNKDYFIIKKLKEQKILTATFCE